jgi:hypothetical protein
MQADTARSNGDIPALAARHRAARFRVAQAVAGVHGSGPTWMPERVGGIAEAPR